MRNDSLDAWAGWIAVKRGRAPEVREPGQNGGRRPQSGTAGAIIAGLPSILWSGGTGSEAMGRIAAPVVGGMVSVAILTLAVIPAAYLLWKQWSVTSTKQS